MESGPPEAGGFDQMILPSDLRREPGAEEAALGARTKGAAVRATGSAAATRQSPSFAEGAAAGPMHHAAHFRSNGTRPAESPSSASTPRTSLPAHPSPVPPSTRIGAGSIAEHVVLTGERRYTPKTDFALAAGDGDKDLVRLPPEAAIFFFCELASLHAAVREDDLASQLLWRARRPSDRLPGNHPDTAVVWCSFGRVAYLAGAFDVAARAISRGRHIRERTLGGDTVETATSYNNLACCFVALDRPVEALAYLELADEILRAVAGEDHPRSQTASRNLEKVRSMQKHWHCQVPHLFSFLVKDSRFKGKIRKKKKGGKGSSAGSTSGKSSASAKSKGK